MDRIRNRDSAPVHGPSRTPADTLPASDLQCQDPELSVVPWCQVIVPYRGETLGSPPRTDCPPEVQAPALAILVGLPGREVPMTKQPTIADTNLLAKLTRLSR